MTTQSRPKAPEAPSNEQELQQTIAQILQQGENHYRTGQIQAAEELFRAIIEIQPEHPEANHDLGVLLVNTQQPKEGLPYFRTAVTASPKTEQYWLSYIEALLLAEQPAAAYSTLELGRKNGLKGPAVEELEQRLKPTREQFTAAAQSGISTEKDTSPTNIPLSKPKKAPTIQDIKKLASLQRKGRVSAIEGFAKDLIVRFPDHGLGWKTMGALQHKQGLIDEALQSMQKATALYPENPEVLNDYGILLSLKARISDAESHFKKALEIKPDFYPALTNLGLLLRDTGRSVESEVHLRRALEIEPNVMSYNNLGATLVDLNRLVEAETCYRQSLKINPRFAVTHANLGVALRKEGRLTEAIEQQRRAVKLSPENTELQSHLLFTLNYTTSSTNFFHLEEARQFGQLVKKRVKEPISSWLCPARPKRLRVGLVSGDFINHPVGYFLQNVLGNIDPNQIELIAYTTNPRVDDLTVRLKKSFHAWKPLIGLSDEAAAQLIRADGIHVLIDLSGHTSRNRLPMLAWKPAPVQVNWLGYFATTGLSEIDYLLVDEVGVPESQRENFTETLWYLPDTRLCFGAPTCDLSVSPLPSEKLGAITFGCFQQLTKVNDEVLKIWSAVMNAVPHSRLRWQCRQFSDPAVVEQLNKRLQTCGLDTDKVSTHGVMPRLSYLAAHAEVDMILDTFPYPGGTTTCEALWMGVPTLTLAGNSLLSRQGASLLSAAGLAEWVATSEAEYVHKAITFANNPHELSELRTRLRVQVLDSPLFNAHRFALNFEEALWGMWQQKQPSEACLGPIDKKDIKKIVKSKTSSPKTFLHVGCGPQRKNATTQGFNTDNWIELRLDINEMVNPDIVGTMTDMSRVADSSVDAIFSSHNIEHLYPHEVPHALKEFLRVLKPDGFAVITCPDLKSVCALVAEDRLTEPAYHSPAGPIAPLDILYGHRAAMLKGNLYMSHRCGFTEKVLNSTLRDAGFEVVATTARPASFDLWAIASKTPRTQDEMRELAAVHFIRSGRH
jgi:protein O-GlcNAc transferase